jgi:cysteine-rich repeat protein
MSRRWLVAVSVAAHLSILIGVFVTGVWRLDKLERGPVRTRLDGWHPPPPPEPAPSGGPVSTKLPDDFHPKHPKEIVKKTVQPEVQPEVKQQPEIGAGSGAGSGSGSGSASDTGTCLENCGPGLPADPVCGNGAVETGEQCDDGNTRSGDGCSASCRIEVRPPVQTNVLPTVLQGLRVSGETQVHPSEATQSEMAHDGTRRVDGTVKLCIGVDGAVTQAKMLGKTGYDAYDTLLIAAVRDWRYQPYRVGDRAVPACSTVHFVYTIR